MADAVNSNQGAGTVAAAAPGFRAERRAAGTAAILVLVIVGFWMLWNAVDRGQSYQRSAYHIMRTMGISTGNEIQAYIERERTRLSIFADENSLFIEELVNSPDSDELVETMHEHVVRHFPGAFAFTVADQKGVPLVEDFDGLVGEVCRRDIHDFSLRMEGDGSAYPELVLHPQPFAYHFDFMAATKLRDDKKAIFLVSLSTQAVVDILHSNKLPGYSLLLVNASEPGLIEVTGRGARDKLGDDTHLLPEDFDRIGFSTLVQGTGWRLLVLPDKGLMAAAIHVIRLQTGLSYLALIFMAVMLMRFVSVEEQRRSLAENRLHRLLSERLDASEARNEAILQSVPDGIIVIDEQGTIHQFNPAAVRIFGYSEQEVVGQNVKMLMPDPYRREHDEYLARYLHTGHGAVLGKRRELVGRRKNGELFAMELAVSELEVNGKRMFTGITSDISSRKKIEHDLHELTEDLQRSNHDLEQFAYIASHDLQEPLRMVSSYTGLLASRYRNQLDEDARTFIDFAVDGAERMRLLIQDLLAYSRVGTKGKPLLPVDSGHAIALACRNLQIALDESSATLEIADDLPYVLADEGQLVQVFQNLIGNAIKFHRRDEAPRVEVSSSSAGGGMVEFVVRDNGIGMEEINEQRIFEVFQRLHGRDEYSGTGIGLSLCKKIVERHGGVIRVHSTPGQGSSFLFTLMQADAIDPAISDGLGVADEMHLHTGT